MHGHGKHTFVGIVALALLAGCGDASEFEEVGSLSEELVVALPARIEAENYERFYETTAGNSGGQCDRADNVDKQLAQDPTGGNCNVGWTAAGEWLEYDVSTPNGGTFNITARVASAVAGRTFRVLLDGVSLGSHTAPSGGWQAWQDRTYSNVKIGAGNHVLRVYFETAEVNFNYLNITAITPPPSCTDGVQNGTETGVDCGGSCAPCPTGCVEQALTRTAATASSSESASYPASYAIDNSTSTRWASAFSDPQWITVDLGATRKVSKVVLNWEAAASRSYDVQISGSSSGPWTTLYTTNVGDGGIDTLANLSGTGRYVRMYSRSRTTAWGNSLWDFQVHGDPNPNCSTTTPTCTDGVKNGSETAVDCGGPTCGDCSNGKSCSLNGDCVSDFCNAGVCRAELPWWQSYCADSTCGGTPLVVRVCPDSNLNCSPSRQTTVVPRVDGQQISQVLLPIQVPAGNSLHYVSGNGQVLSTYVEAFTSPVVIRSDVTLSVSYYNAPVVWGGTTNLNFVSEVFPSAEVLTTVFRFPTYLTAGEPAEFHTRGRNIIIRESEIASIYPGKMKSYFLPSELSTGGEGNYSNGALRITSNYSNPGYIDAMGGVYNVAMPRFSHEYVHELFSEVTSKHPGNNICLNEGIADAFPYAAGFLPEADFGPLGQVGADFNQGCAETMVRREEHEVGNCPLWQVKRLNRMTTAFATAVLNPRTTIDFDSCDLTSARTGNALIVLYSEAAGVDMTQAIQMAEIPSAGSYTAAKAALGL